MQSRVVPLEEGKDPAVSIKTTQSKPFPMRLLQLFLLFIALCIAFSIISMYTVKRFGVQSVVATVKPSLKPCFDETNTLDRWIRPPSKLLHKMSDKELLWRASFVPRIKKYPFNRVPKIAFMFLTKGPLPLAPLWERFLKGHEGLYSIYVHPMPTFEAKFPPSSVFHRRQIPSQVCKCLCYPIFYLCLLLSPWFHCLIYFTVFYCLFDIYAIYKFWHRFGALCLYFIFEVSLFINGHSLLRYMLCNSAMVMFMWNPVLLKFVSLTIENSSLVWISVL